MVDRFDVIIVGGRVGGATLASLLGQRGVSVLLLDKASFPSDTLSTHVIYGDSFGPWERIGVWPDILATGTDRMVAIDWRQQPPAANVWGRFRPVNGHDCSMCIRRLLLDDLLWRQAASSPGVTALERASATDVLVEHGRAVGVRYERVSNGRRERATARAELVVGADGRFSTIARLVGARSYNVVPPILFPLYSYLRDVEPTEPQVLTVVDSPEAQGIIMLAPCDDGIWLGIIYTPQEQYESVRRDHRRIFWERIRADSTVGPRLARARMIAPVRGRGDLVNFMRVAAGPGWALVGDAGQHKDPLFGQGIGDAVRTADLLADHVGRAARGDTGLDDALIEFAAYRDLDLLPNFDWMIKRLPRGWEQGDVDRFLSVVGSDPEMAERFVNVFSHAVSAAELFGPETLGWLSRRPGASAGVRDRAVVTATPHP